VSHTNTTLPYVNTEHGFPYNSNIMKLTFEYRSISQPITHTKTMYVPLPPPQIRMLHLVLNEKILGISFLCPFSIFISECQIVQLVL